MSDNHIGLLPTSYKGNAEDTNLLLDRFTNSRKARELEEKVRDREETTASITALRVESLLPSKLPSPQKQIIQRVPWVEKSKISSLTRKLPFWMYSTLL